METLRQPRVDMTPKAQDYLRRAGVKDLYVEQVFIDQCCIPLVAPPDVRKGIPRKPEQFNPLQFEEFTVYYEKNLLAPPVITIDIQNYGFAKTLVIRDWKIKI